MSRDPEITDYDYILSTVGNAYYSGLSFQQLWQCVAITDNVIDLDTAVSAEIRLNEIRLDQIRSVYE